MPLPRELVFFLNFLLTRAFDSYYATTIPEVNEQTGLLSSNAENPVTIGGFTNTNPDPSAMIFEIKVSFDETQSDAPTVQLDSAGPSLKITFNSWSTKFAVCVA